MILDTVGRSSISGRLAVLNDGGFYLLANPNLSALVRGLGVHGMGAKRVITGSAVHSSEKLDALRDLIVEGKLRSVIDRRFPLKDVAEAHRYFETGQAVGRVAVTV